MPGAEPRTSGLRLIPPAGAPIEIASDRTLLGRDPSADIVVNDPSVSRRHAIIERRPEGWAVFDQRSANGTWLDNQRVEQALLASGQQLRFGAVTFEVILPGVVAATRPIAVGSAAPAYAPPVAAPPPAPPRPVYAPAPVAPPPAGPPSYPPRPAPPAARLPQGGAPAYVPPPAPAPGPAGPRAPAPAASGGMTEAEAAEILGLWPGSPAEEVRRKYQKLYNDFQVRLTNAPTPSLKKMYQKSIQDLRTAADLICPGALA